MKKTLTALLSLLIYSGLMLSSAGCSRQSGSENAEESLSRQWVRELRSVSKLQLASMSVGKTVKSECHDWYKIGKRIAVYSYDTYLYAYIDLSELEENSVEVDETNRIVRIRLPEVKTEIAGREMEMHKEYENIGLLRSNINSKERAEMKEKANKELMKELGSDSEFVRVLKEEGEAKARVYFETLAAKRGFTAEVTIKGSESK